MITDLLREQPIVINIGVHDFADALVAQGVTVIQVDWAPPPTLDPEVASILDVLG